MDLKKHMKASMWAGWWLAALAWLIHLLGSFVLVDWYCQSASMLSSSRMTLLLHLMTVFCLLTATGGLALAIANVRNLSRNHSGFNEQRSSSRFLALGGIGFSAFLIAVIAMQGWGNFVLEPCQ